MATTTTSATQAPVQTLDQFLADNRAKINPATGRFYGPHMGVAYDLEDVNAVDFYDQNIGHQYVGGLVGAGDDMRFDPYAGERFTANLNDRTAWKPGPDNGGGFFGGLGRNFDSMVHDPRSWAVLAAAYGGSSLLGSGTAAAEGGLGFSPTAAGFSPAADSLAASNALGAGTAGLSTGSVATAVASQIPEGMTFAEFAATPAGQAAITEANAAAAATSSGVTGGGLGSMVGEGAAATGMTAEQAAALQTGMNGGGSLTKAALYGAEGYGPAASPAELAAAKGMGYADLVKTFGPTAAKLAVGALAAKGISGSGAGNGSGGGGIDSIISAAFGNTQSMLDEYNTVFKPWAVDQVGKIGARGDEGYDTLMGLSKAPNRFVDQFGEYTDRIGSQGYRDQQRGLAMGTVQQQADAQLDQARRAAVARGVDPARFALQQNQLAANVAAAKTKAAADAEGMAWDQWGKASQTAAGLKWQDANTRAGLVTAANNLGQNGFNAGTKLAGVDAGYRGGLTDSWSKMAATQNESNKTTNANNQWNEQHSLGGLVTSTLADAGGKWLKDNSGKWLENILPG